MTLTTGTLIFLAGAVLLAVGLVMLIVLLVTGPARKKKIQRRMREKY